MFARLALSRGAAATGAVALPMLQRAERAGMGRTVASALSCSRQWSSGPSPFSPRLVEHPTRRDAQGQPIQYLKFKSPLKRAGFVMEMLEKEAVEKAQARVEIPDIRAGDSVEVQYKPPKTPDGPVQTFRGIVIRYRKAGMGTSLMVLNHIRGQTVEQSFPLYSNWIVGVKVLKQAAIRKKGAVKHSRIYWLRDRAVDQFTVPTE